MVQAASLFNQLLQHFPRAEFAALVQKARRGTRQPKGLAAGRSWWRCCSARWPMPTLCARSAMGWPVLWANWCTSESPWLPTNPPCPMPTSIGPRSCTRICFTRPWSDSATKEGLGPRKRKFRFKNKLLSLDSTTISLCLELFPWAKIPPGERRRQGTCPAGPRRLPAPLRPDHRSPVQRRENGRRLSAQPRFHRGHGSWL